MWLCRCSVDKALGQDRSVGWDSNCANIELFSGYYKGLWVDLWGVDRAVGQIEG